MTGDVKCPICGGKTTIRPAKKGPGVGEKFYVCNRYPDCKGRIPVIVSELTSPSVSDNDKFNCVFDGFKNKCNATVTDYEENKYLKSFFIGGNVAALGVVTYCEDLRKLWGAGSIEMAKLLSELFALEMISIWSRKHAEKARDSNEKYTQDAIDKFAKYLAIAILNICDDYSDEALIYFIKMDKQLNHDKDIGNRGMVRDSLLLLRAYEVCGQSRIDWNKVTLPVESQQQLLQANAIYLPHPADVMKMVLCVTSGIKTMYEVQQIEV